MKPHGTKASYQRGCRCLPCRLAPARYQREYVARKKRGEMLLISPDETRERLLQLRKQGLGRRRVSELTGISERTLFMIIKGRCKTIHQNTARKVALVNRNAAAQGINVAAQPTIKRLNTLKREGFTSAELGRRFGLKRELQIAKSGKLVKKRTEQRIKDFYNVIMAGA